MEAEKKEAFRPREEEEDERDRTREKAFRRYEEYENKYDWPNSRSARAARPVKKEIVTPVKKEIVKHQEDVLPESLKGEKESQMERLRKKRL